MSALVLPFPRCRNRSFVLRHAARMASLPATTAEKHLAHLLAKTRETMRRRGVDPITVEADSKALECAIRAELWHLVLTPTGAA